MSKVDFRKKFQERIEELKEIFPPLGRDPGTSCAALTLTNILEILDGDELKSHFFNNLAIPFSGLASYTTQKNWKGACGAVGGAMAAIGIIMTPIYLLSMLRLVFYNSNEALACDIDKAKQKKPTNEPAVCFGNSCVLPGEAPFEDANPREIFIAACFLVLILGIGIYPKLATQMYDVKTVAINAEVRHSQTIIAQQQHSSIVQIATINE